jgi:hypothetical protein
MAPATTGIKIHAPENMKLSSDTAKLKNNLLRKLLEILNRTVCRPRFHEPQNARAGGFFPAARPYQDRAGAYAKNAALERNM